MKIILKILFAFCFCIPIATAQNTKIDSLRNALKSANIDSIKIKLNLEITKFYLNVLPDSTIAVGKRTLQKFDAVDDTFYIYDFTINIGEAFQNKGDFKQAKIYFNKALNLSLNNKNLEEEGRAYSRLANLYGEEHDFFNALAHNKKSLEINRRLNNMNAVSTIMNNIGNIYLQIENYDKALEFYSECLEINKNDANSENRTVLLNIGLIHIKQKAYLKTIEIVKPAIAESKKYNDIIALAFSYHHLAHSYLYLGDTDKGVFYSKKALDIIDEVKTNVLRAIIYNLLSKAYEPTNLDTALQYANKSYDVAKKSNSTEDLQKATLQLFKLYRLKKDFKQASTYAALQMAYKDTLNENKENARFIREQIGFEIKEVEFKKDLELAELKNTSQEKEYNMNLAQERSNFMWLGLLVLVMVFYVIMITIQKRKIKKIMAENIQLETRVEEIETSIANDLHDNFGNRLAGVLTSYNIVKEINKNTKNKDPNFKKFSKNIENNLMSLNGDIKDLLWAMNPDNNEFKTIIRRLKMIFKGFESRSDVKIRLSHTKTQARFMMPKLANRQLVLILKEVVNNAMKYSKTDYIDISIFIDRDNHLIIDCVDYGIGFDIDKLSRINGLNHIKERAQLIKFNVEVNSRIGKGTKIALKSIYPLKRTNFKNVS